LQIVDWIKVEDYWFLAILQKHLFTFRC